MECQNCNHRFTLGINGASFQYDDNTIMDLCGYCSEKACTLGINTAQTEPF